MKVLVVGSGVAGLTCALSLVESGHSVTIVTKSQTSDSATWYAQGGVASAMFSDDSTDSHIQDTLVAGVGLCDLSAVEILVNEGAGAVKKLVSRGAHFDRLADGSYARTREGGHHNNRIIHAGGDATGEEIERSLVKAASNSDLAGLKVIDYHMVSRLLVNSNICVGIECVDANGHIDQIEADHVVMATGGAGQLYSVTTNPILSTADGVATALKSGVVCADLEFMQFHPTALHVDNMPRPLLSEALRGEGSVLRDENGIAFMQGVHKMADLAPRDVVSREITRVLRDHEIENVFLDATHINDFPQRFPTIFSSCESANIDPRIEFIPVSPAAHYFCGGVITDTFGATSMPSLWAAGEVACNGVHGANRLASNSLLEGLVFGDRVARAINDGQNCHTNTGIFSNYNTWDKELTSPSDDNIANRKHINLDISKVATYRRHLQSMMTKNVGVLRTEESLHFATSILDELAKLIAVNEQVDNSFVTDFSMLELEHLLDVSKCVIASALSRTESRGCHIRDDFPQPSDKLIGRQMVRYVQGNVSFVPLNQDLKL